MSRIADSISDFKIIDDGGCRRVSVFGMGWTGFTLGKADDSVVDFRTNDLGEDPVLEWGDFNFLLSQCVFDDDLSALAHYFYNLGRQHGAEELAKA